VVKLNVAGDLIVMSLRERAPEPVKIVPSALLINNLSQHCSVENDKNLTRMYPVSVISVIQFILNPYSLPGGFVWRKKSVAEIVPVLHIK